MTKHIEDYRHDFPLLTKTGRDQVIYFDNACMSLRPRQVIEAITKYYTDYPACAGRSNHRLARKVTELVEESRETVRRFLGAKKAQEIVFVRNTSEGINLVANSFHFQPQDVVVTTGKEHNSNLVPWLKLQEQGKLSHRVLPVTEQGEVDLHVLEQWLQEGVVRLVSVVQSANLDGSSVPLQAITTLAHRYKALVLVDGAQGVPHHGFDLKKTPVDFLTFSGHKMLGPSGIGVLYGRYELLEALDGFMVGGDTVVETFYDHYTLLPPPEKFEAGLQHYSGIIGLKAAVEYLRQVGFEAIEQQELKLNQLITKAFAANERITILGPQAPEQRGGIVSFTVEGADPHQIALMADEMAGVLVRSGQHCVHSWFNDQKIRGSVRASLYFYNTEVEAELFVNTIEKIVQVI